MAKIIHGRRKTKWKPWSVEDRRFLALSLAGEVGEICNLIKKDWRDGETRPRQKRIRSEIGDAAVYLELLKIAYQVDLEKENGPKLMRLAKRKWPETLRHLKAAGDMLRMLSG